MLSIKDLENPRDISLLLSANIQTELEHWQNLSFSFDSMDDDKSNNSSSASKTNSSERRNARSRSQSVNQQGSNPTDAALLAQFAAGAGLPQPQPHDPSYAVLMALLQAQHVQAPPGSFQMGINPQLYGQHSPPQPNFNLHWPPPFNQQHNNFLYNDPGMSALHTGYHGLPRLNTNLAPARNSATPLGVPLDTTTSPVREDSPDPDLGDPGIVEDKRRRNTAASARFRIKKKQRNLNLERTVSDLTGRADELEKEASDLRRENGWLKEIIMMKKDFRGFGAGDSQPQALSQTLPKPPDSDSTFWGPGVSTSSYPTLSSSSRLKARHQRRTRTRTRKMKEVQGESGNPKEKKGKN
ncbi:hypothetical protein BDP27DRAFT_1332039, partial [Rhodocollybia butyracea]